jgi:hypothetical protein
MAVSVGGEDHDGKPMDMETGTAGDNDASLESRRQAKEGAAFRRLTKGGLNLTRKPLT